MGAAAATELRASPILDLGPLGLAGLLLGELLLFALSSYAQAVPNAPELAWRK